MNLSPLRVVYLVLAIIGAVVPMLHLGPWAARNGLTPGGLWHAWQANQATAGLAWDLAIAALALTVWVVAETWVRKNWVALWAVPATFLVGVSFGLPLFLFLRAAPIR